MFACEVEKTSKGSALTPSTRSRTIGLVVPALVVGVQLELDGLEGRMGVETAEDVGYKRLNSLEPLLSDLDACFHSRVGESLEALGSI